MKYILFLISLTSILRKLHHAWTHIHHAVCLLGFMNKFKIFRMLLKIVIVPTTATIDVVRWG